MAFASGWLQKGTLFGPVVEEAPGINTGIIAVVPSLNEPNLTALFNSLNECTPPVCGVEVIVVVNAPSDAPEEARAGNRKELINIRRWTTENNPFFRLYAVHIEDPPVKGWGVGLARKTGMDEALRRLSHINRPEGVIACLDGDCTVSASYFISLEDELLKRKDRRACAVYFEHPITGTEYSPEIYSAITQYELHLRYYLMGLKYSGFPDAFHTIGSTIAVKADTYMKAGGMNRRQAGEDFYFVQKLVPLGGFFSLNSATVFPSPRRSGRVPFGTGNVIGKMTDRGETVFKTYNPSAFTDLKVFFGICSSGIKENGGDYRKIHASFPQSVREYIMLEEWKDKMDEISRNTSGTPAFTKRFFGWFNMFRVVKYLNHAHISHYSKVTAEEAACKILERMGIEYYATDAKTLLMKLRMIEKGS